MIKSLQLHNFKCYKNQLIELTNLTVFCGNNSVGKSTAIQALGIILQSQFQEKVNLNGGFVSLGYHNDIHNYANKDQESLSIGINFKGTDYIWGYSVRESTFDMPSSLDWLGEKSEAGITSLKEVGQFYDECGVQYLQAERLGPRDFLKLPDAGFSVNDLGAKGEYVHTVLNRLQYIEARRLVQEDPRLHPEAKNPHVYDNIEHWMKEISPNFKISSTVELKANISFGTFHINNDEIRSVNMGFGLSYVLSIVTALVNAKKGGLVIIENPEAHLHPRGQSYLGRLIALTALAGVQVIVETHSDHLINGMRIIARTHNSFESNLFCLYYVSADDNNNESHVEKITLTKDGKLSNWPKGFFDQQAIDMMLLVTGKN